MRTTLVTMYMRGNLNKEKLVKYTVKYTKNVVFLAATVSAVAFKYYLTQS